MGWHHKSQFSRSWVNRKNLTNGKLVTFFQLFTFEQSSIHHFITSFTKLVQLLHFWGSKKFYNKQDPLNDFLKSKLARHSHDQKWRCKYCIDSWLTCLTMISLFTYMSKTWLHCWLQIRLSKTSWRHLARNDLPLGLHNVGLVLVHSIWIPISIYVRW